MLDHIWLIRHDEREAQRIHRRYAYEVGYCKRKSREELDLDARMHAAIVSGGIQEMLQRQPKLAPEPPGRRRKYKGRFRMYGVCPRCHEPMDARAKLCKFCYLERLREHRHGIFGPRTGRRCHEKLHAQCHYGQCACKCHKKRGAKDARRHAIS